MEDELSVISSFFVVAEIELGKAEKRYKLNPAPPEPPLESEPAIESVLPIPRDHPDALMYSADFLPKVGFLKTIGLNVMPPSRRDGRVLFIFLQ